MVKFVPTGGIDLSNLSEYADKDFIHAIGGGWLCSTKDMAEGTYSNITDTIKKSIDVLLGFEIAHIGINMESEDVSLELAAEVSKAFGMALKQGNSSNFAGTQFEIMKKPFKGSYNFV